MDDRPIPDGHAQGAKAPPRPQVRRVALGAPLRWLARGAGDLRAAPGIAAFYGLCFWAMAATLAAVFFDTGMPSTAGVLEAVFNPRNWQFLAVYLAVGGVFAALVFCSTVVAIPMILDRDTDAVTAALTSFRVVLDNTAALLLWGALVAVLTLLALWPWSLGLLVVGPWLGHATWHAYRDAVGWDREL